MASFPRPAGVAALLAAGCAEVDATPPELIAAEFERPDRVILRFSEPLGPIADVDPEHFRMSTALVIDDGQGGELTVYYDLANHFSEGLPGQDGQQPDLDGPWPRHAFTIVAALERGEARDELILQLSYPVEPAVCAALDQAAALGIPAGIFVHYGQAEYPRIVDEAGNPLADIAGDWIAVNGVATAPGAFPELDPTLAIPCPE
ncbi:hypothetical protein ACNOYE_33860 [Nannocystaceae bacterium ST9]